MPSAMTVSESKVQIRTPDGVADAYVFHPGTGGPWPGVLFYMDALGIRPKLLEMGKRLASGGYFVLLSDLFYRSAPYQPIDPTQLGKDGPERARMMKMYSSINNDLVMRDTTEYLLFLGENDQVAGDKIGTIGYCMGGTFAVLAAGTFPDHILAAASFHGGRLATDSPDSPHLLAPKMRAKVYIGIAGIDPYFTPEEKQTLESALKSAGVRYTTDTYENVKHGFAVTDHPAYDKDASERHWVKLFELFGQTLQGK
jgi:carboxymethylenebutenolidase